MFFLKQKTAYEIVGCDWSSDVCSSDLGRKFAPEGPHSEFPPEHLWALEQLGIELPPDSYSDRKSVV